MTISIPFLLAVSWISFALGYYWSGVVRRAIRHHHDQVIQPDDHPKFITRA